MKIVLISIGSRGDVEPFLAIGEFLLERGHQVICAFPEQFRNLVEASNLEFASLGTEFLEMLDSEAGKAVLGGDTSGLKKILAYIRLARISAAINRDLTHRQHEIVAAHEPDKIFHNGKALYPIIWGLDKNAKTALLSPVPYLHSMNNHTHLAFNSNYGRILNKFTYSLANFGLVTAVKMAIKSLKITRKITRQQIGNALVADKAIYTISPALFSRPDYWHKNLQVLGYYERSKDHNFQPPKELSNFLEKHSKILFITFGSMTNPEPQQKTKILLNILERNNIAAVINTAAGGLCKAENYNDELIHFLTEIPYDWILPKTYAAVHHGGSGTTHLGLKYGCASMIIPHIIDQFVWSKIIYNKGAGPMGIRINKLTEQDLEPKILELMNNTAFKRKAEEISVQMKNEDFREELYQSLME